LLCIISDAHATSSKQLLSLLLIFLAMRLWRCGSFTSWN